MSFGNWENQSWDNLPRAETNLWAANWKTTAAPDGESWEDLVIRVAEFLKELSPSKNHLIIAHLGVIRAARCVLENMDADQVFEWKLNFLEHHTIQ